MEELENVQNTQDEEIEVSIDPELDFKEFILNYLEGLSARFDELEERIDKFNVRSTHKI